MSHDDVTISSTIGRIPLPKLRLHEISNHDLLYDVLPLQQFWELYLPRFAHKLQESLSQHTGTPSPLELLFSNNFCYKYTHNISKQKNI